MSHTYRKENETEDRRSIIMNESTTKTTKTFTGCASLAALGVKLRELDLFGPIREVVQIAQTEDGEAHTHRQAV